jgi:glycosyltransferase involved in cell wall biosynthesis
MLAVNGRFMDRRITGVERYAREVLTRFKTDPTIIRPHGRLQGLLGHAWEQLVLPSRLSRRTLWSPCNTGPVATARQVVTIHDMAVFDHPEWFSKRFAAVYRTIIPELARRACGIIAVSSFTKERLVQTLKLDESKVHVIANGVASSFSPRLPAEIAAVRSRLAIPDGPYVLSLCSLEPRKNLANLFAAWAIVKRNNHNVNLVLGGASGKSDIFRSFNQALPPSSKGVVLTGYVGDDDLPALYSGALCFVYPSLYEGFGLPVLEALSCGVPVVTSDSTSLREVAQHICRLVDPMSAREIAAAICELLDKEHSPELIALNCNYAARYTWERCAAETEHLLLYLNQ